MLAGVRVVGVGAGKGKGKGRDGIGRKAEGDSPAIEREPLPRDAQPLGSIRTVRPPLRSERLPVW